MSAINLRTNDEHKLAQEAERQMLISELENTMPNTSLGAKLLALRLQMLRNGQQLFSADEINRELGREPDEDLS